MDDDPRYMLAIVEHGSINKAAAAMHLSQPALSHRLKALEGRLGCQLFERGETPLRPTASGEVYLAYARKAIAAEKQMAREVYSVATNRKRRLRIAVSAPRCEALMPEVITRFCAAQQGCSVTTFTAGNSEDVERMLASRDADFALMTPVHLDSALYASELLCYERQVFVAPRGWQIPFTPDADGRRRVALEEIANWPFVMPTTRQYFDELIRKIMDEAGVHLNIVFQSCEAELAARVVGEGLGVTILPNTFVYGWPGGNLDLYELDGFEGARGLHYIQRIGWDPDADTRLFMSEVRAWIAAHPEFDVPADPRAGAAPLSNVETG